MRPLTQQELQWLLGCQDDTCISIYLPVHRRLPESSQNPILYKQLLSRVEELLVGSGNSSELLEPLRHLGDGDFWRHQEEGLAIFRSEAVMVYYRLPVPVPELAVVADAFHTKPLVAYLNTRHKYFLLALSRNQVTLYQGTPHRLVPVNLTGLPANLREALGVEERAKQLSSHASGPGRQSVFHGQGAAETDRRDEVARYFREIDKALWSYLRHEHAPLVLAGVREYHPIYHEVSRYPYLLDEGVEGNVDRVSPEQIHTRAWPLVQSELAKQEEELLARFHQLLGQGRSSDDLGQIGRAAAFGRVRWLILEQGKQVWGHFHRESGQVDVHQEQVERGDGDVLNEISESVLRCDGQVLVLGRERMPTSSPVAAIYRY